jgi:hypothetical protein
MAGRVRHPIDVKALERYIEEHVPEIKTPLEVKQVGCPLPFLLSEPDRLFSGKFRRPMDVYTR